jgi:hypothetical protein
MTRADETSVAAGACLGPACPALENCHARAAAGKLEPDTSADGASPDDRNVELTAFVGIRHVQSRGRARPFRLLVESQRRVDFNGYVERKRTDSYSGSGMASTLAEDLDDQIGCAVCDEVLFYEVGG